MFLIESKQFLSLPQNPALLQESLFSLDSIAIYPVIQPKYWKVVFNFLPAPVS